MMQTVDRCADMVATGRDLPDVIFMSKFTPALPPPRLRVEMGGEAALQYRGRSTEADDGLREAFFNWQAQYGVDRKGMAVKFSHSAITDVLPAIFDSPLFSSDDTLLFCSPTYSMVLSGARVRGMNIVAVPGEIKDDYKPSAASIAEALQQHPEARALLLVNPANPTGKSLTPEELEAIGAVITEHNAARNREGKKPLLVIADQTFQDLILEQEAGAKAKLPALASNKALRHCMVSVGSLSKTAGPGLGIAYWYGAEELLKTITLTDGLEPAGREYARRYFRSQTGALNQQLLYEDENNPVVSANQHIESNREIYQANYRRLCDYFSDLNRKLREKLGGDKDYITWIKPDAGFHVTVSFAGLSGLVPGRDAEKLFDGDAAPITSGEDLSRELLNHEKLAVFPGEMFFMKPEAMALRLSLNLTNPEDSLYPDEKFMRGLKRIGHYCMSLSPEKKATWAERRSSLPNVPGQQPTL